ncbi:transmembrane protein 244-like isoform X4 [Gigantopelta aegis]|uniref:transmembrane protein 244-like isoform X4 n=1 Tax=Gigantopelta aegis TaxID=1735272 RepID=UPI001B889E66|nr:transmembrane protein 244-like isoform X4 [Gigantopelta aegis]
MELVYSRYSREPKSTQHKYLSDLCNWLHFQEILFNLLKCLGVFYAVYYAVGSLCFAGFKLQFFDGKIPFDFLSWIDLSLCCVKYTSEQIVNLLSMLLSFSICGFIYGILVPNWIWDYAVTVTIIHILMCCLVMLNFPLNWSWWVCLTCALILEIFFGEILSYIKRQKIRAKVAVTVEQEPSNYLHNKT